MRDLVYLFPVPVEASIPEVPEVKPKPRKLIALQYNYSDSEDEDTRVERRARIVSNIVDC